MESDGAGTVYIEESSGRFIKGVAGTTSNLAYYDPDEIFWYQVTDSQISMRKKLNPLKFHLFSSVSFAPSKGEDGWTIHRCTIRSSLSPEEIRTYFKPELPEK